MRVFLLIAALLLATAVLMTESSRRRRSRGGRRRSRYRRRGYVAGDGDFEKRREEKLQNARDMLENLMNDVEEGAFLDMGKGQDQEMEGADGDTFEKKMATYQETEDELDEENDAVEEDAALGLMEEELEELQEEVEEVIGNLGGTN